MSAELPAPDGNNAVKPKKAKRLLKWGIAAVVAAGLLSSAGIYVYINFLKDDAPPPLSFEQRDKQAASTLVAASGCDTPVSKKFDSQGSLQITATDSAGATMTASSSAISGEVMVCNGTVVGGTVDVDATSLKNESAPAQGDALRSFLDADEFQVITITFQDATSATATIKGEDISTLATGEFDGDVPKFTVLLSSP
jgi:hypothetical protein